MLKLKGLGKVTLVVISVRIVKRKSMHSNSRAPDQAVLDKFAAQEESRLV